MTTCLRRTSLPSLMFLAALVAVPSASRAAANHVVISEFATRGPSAATDEFVELYNPTLSPVNIAGWHLQYKSATGSTWNDRAILPANTTIGPHGFFLIANQSYDASVGALKNPLATSVLAELVGPGACSRR